MKILRFFFIILFVFLAKIIPLFAQIIEPCTKSGSLMVVEEKSNNIIFETNPHQIIYPASLVKMMTAYLTFEAIKNQKFNEDDDIIFSPRAQEVSNFNKNNTLRVKNNDRIEVLTAVKGLIIKSYNETAIALAEKIAGDEWQFVRLMNKKALELGMINTAFKNASGWHDEGQYSTASDLIKLAMHLKKDFPEYFYLFSLKDFNYQKISTKSHNRFLYSFEGAEGMKTGYTSQAGYNLVAVANKNNTRLFSVVTGCKSSNQRDELTKFVLDLSFLENAENNNFYFKKISLKNNKIISK
jgi:D-alanyl-D-alanine carboxypeptidase (penicillin-binding protein 5/6)